MNITPVTATTNTIGKHKIPRFIYHLTNKLNYEDMQKDGFIKPNPEYLCGNNIFAINLTNFFKRWRRHKDWQNDSLQNELLNMVQNMTYQIVILKIPTANLDANKLRLRSQNQLFRWADNDEILDTMIKQAKEKFKGRKERYTEKEFKEELGRVKRENAPRHLVEGAPAKFTKLFTRRKEAIEYLYPEPIPMSKVEKIGEVDYDNVYDSQNYDFRQHVKFVLKELLKGTPEAKGVEFL